jgi:hypothetical protein
MRLSIAALPWVFTPVWTARHGISANVIAAYYHDHIFVPFDRVEQAMTALESIDE